MFNLTGGIVGPGTSPDTLILTDDFTQDAQSRFEVEIFGFLQGSEFDFLDLEGEAFLDGFVDVIVDPAFRQTLVIGDSFVILEADGGVNDMFASLNVNLAGPRLRAESPRRSRAAPA